MTATRLVSASSRRRVSTARARSAVFQEDATVDDDSLTGRDARHDRHDVAHPWAQHDFPSLETAGRALEEDDGVTILLDDGGDGEHGRRLRITGVADGREHLGPEAA